MAVDVRISQNSIRRPFAWEVKIEVSRLALDLLPRSWAVLFRVGAMAGAEVSFKFEGSLAVLSRMSAPL